MHRMTGGCTRLARLGLAFLFLISSHQALFVLASVSKEAPEKPGRALASTTEKATTTIASGYRRSLKIPFALIFMGKLEACIVCFAVAAGLL